jgi:hypothetical protein
MTRIEEGRRPAPQPAPAPAAPAQAPAAAPAPAAPSAAASAPEASTYTLAASGGTAPKAAEAVLDAAVAIRQARAQRTPSLSLAELPASVRESAARLDLDGNKKLDARDFPGADDAAVQAVLTSLRIMAQNIASARLTPEDIRGKRVLFTGLTNLNRQIADDLVRKMGGTPAKYLTNSVDVLVVGDPAKTTKDEKAFRKNAEARADIRLVRESDFVQAFVHGPPPSGVPANLTPVGRAGEHLLAYGRTPISYSGAFNRLIPAVIRQDGRDTPRNIVRNIAEMAGQPLSEAELDRKMTDLLARGSVELLPPGESNEVGDDPAKAWIFELQIDTESDHGFWAAVDRHTGEVSVSGFN